jgi:hypothetical protein
MVVQPIEGAPHLTGTPLSSRYSINKPFFSKWGAEMNNLEKAHLKRICDKYGIDYYEIDSKISYWECWLTFAKQPQE